MSVGSSIATGKHKSSQSTGTKTYIRPPEDAVFDIGKERNKGNQFWKQGKGREEHREKEMNAKARR